MLAPDTKALLLSAERCYKTLKRAMIKFDVPAEKQKEVDDAYFNAISPKDEIDTSRIF